MSLWRSGYTHMYGKFRVKILKNYPNGDKEVKTLNGTKMRVPGTDVKPIEPDDAK